MPDEAQPLLKNPFEKKSASAIHSLLGYGKLYWQSKPQYLFCLLLGSGFATGLYFASRIRFYNESYPALSPHLEWLEVFSVGGLLSLGLTNAFFRAFETAKKSHESHKKAKAFFSALASRVIALLGAWVYLTDSVEKANVLWPLNYVAQYIPFILAPLSVTAAIYLNSDLHKFTNTETVKEFKSDYDNLKNKTGNQCAEISKLLAKIGFTLSAIIPFIILSLQAKENTVLKIITTLFATINTFSQNYLGAIDLVNTVMTLTNYGLILPVATAASACSNTAKNKRNQLVKKLKNQVQYLLVTHPKLLKLKNQAIKGQQIVTPEHLKLPNTSKLYLTGYSLNYFSVHLLMQTATVISMLGYCYNTMNGSLNLAGIHHPNLVEKSLAITLTTVPFVFLAMSFTYQVTQDVINVAYTGIPSAVKQHHWKLKIAEFSIIAWLSCAVTTGLNRDFFNDINMPEAFSPYTALGVTFLLSTIVTTAIFNCYAKLDTFAQETKNLSNPTPQASSLKVITDHGNSVWQKISSPSLDEANPAPANRFLV